MDCCIRFTRENKRFQHGGDRGWSRPQGLKNPHNFLMTLRSCSWNVGDSYQPIGHLITRGQPWWPSKEKSNVFDWAQSVAETLVLFQPRNQLGTICTSMAYVWCIGLVDTSPELLCKAKRQYPGKSSFSTAKQNATQFCPFVYQICSWLAKYLYINDKDV